MLVLTQRGQSVYLHTHGDLKKIAPCRVKLYELVNTDKNTHNTTEVMKEDGLEDIDNLYTTQLNQYYFNKHSNKQSTKGYTIKSENKTNTHINTVEENTQNVKYTATLRNNLANTKNNTEAHINTVEENLHKTK